MNDTEEKM